MTELAAVRRDLRRSRCWTTLGFDLLYWDPSDFNRINRSVVEQSLFFLMGGYCTGKTTVMKGLRQLGYGQIPEIKTREMREGEEAGREVICVSDADYLEMLRRDEFIIAYKANLGKRQHYVGIRKDAIWQALSRPEPSGIIIHPHAVMVFLEHFWIRSFVLTASEDDHRFFQELRGVSCNDGRSQNCVGAFSDDVMLPGSLTRHITNCQGKLEDTVLNIARCLQ